MSTDRELLEWAAKAAGYEIGFSTDYTGTGIDGEVPYLKPSGDEWNPLTDDGDALRLAVKLGLTISFSAKPKTKVPRTSVWTHGVPEIQERHEDAPYAATRRAIVRAAAEIGKHSAPSKEES